MLGKKDKEVLNRSIRLIGGEDCEALVDVFESVFKFRNHANRAYLQNLTEISDRLRGVLMDLDMFDVDNADEDDYKVSKQMAQMVMERLDDILDDVERFSMIQSVIMDSDS